ncbi:transglutaminase-like domain-containing protein [Promethearchaeum syntrophicum]|uniref:Transglutaminase-like domain-containing protein n=1 Tax=Promethearchaeum syntrophicum TaxID=2594042 RepID=A0A5B9D7K6_9ARCH|nr:transglutaminase-like domain-containing protein [Candidatus Prometheoarchaeum syntrophicum]
MKKIHLNKKNKILAVIVVLLVVGPITVILMLMNNSPSQSYNVISQDLDLDEMNSYPQEIIRINENSAGIDIDIKVKIDKNRLKSVPLENYTYKDEIAYFQNPSSKIQSNSSIIAELAEEIIGEEQDILTIVRLVANWTSSSISYDELLASQIWNGQSQTQDALTTLELMTGTCSEYANVFIAVMRYIGVPTRFITGKRFEGSYHAWAEIYLYEIGWIPVDPQHNVINYCYESNDFVILTCVKLFAGLDFVDIGIKLADLGTIIKKI